MLRRFVHHLLWPTITAIIIMTVTTSYAEDHNYVPKNGFVPDSPTAVSVAEAVSIPIYGREKVESQKPFRASLKGSTWTVTGTLEKGLVGGVAEVVIDKMTGRIIRISHGR